MTLRARRWIAVGSAAALVVLSAGAALPSVAATAEVVEGAYAEWVLPTADGKTLRWFAVEVRRETDPSGGPASVTADVVRGSCRRSPDGALECSGSPVVYTLDEADFRTDPVTSSASVRIRTPRFVHRVGWTTGDAIVDGPRWEQQGCTAGSSAGGGVWHDATAGGRLFDRRMTFEAGRDFAALDYGISAGDCGRSFLTVNRRASSP